MKYPLKQDPYIIALNPATHDHIVRVNGGRVRREYNWLHVDDKLMKLFHCDTCNMYMPLRASHCRKCDKCIEKRDHHCIWIGRCVGKRNYKFFYFYLVSYIVLNAYIISFSIVHLAIVSNAARNCPRIIIDFVICFLSLCFVLYTFCYHNKIIRKGQTAIEETVRFQHIDLFDRGNFCRNFKEALCTPVPPTRT